MTLNVYDDIPINDAIKEIEFNPEADEGYVDVIDHKIKSWKIISER